MNVNVYELGWMIAAAVALFYAVRVRARARTIERLRIAARDNGLRRIVARGKVTRGNWYVVAASVATWMGALAFLTEPSNETRVAFAIGAVVIMFSIARMAIGEDNENEAVARYGIDETTRDDADTAREVKRNDADAARERVRDDADAARELVRDDSDVVRERQHEKRNVEKKEDHDATHE